MDGGQGAATLAFALAGVPQPRSLVHMEFSWHWPWISRVAPLATLEELSAGVTAMVGRLERAGQHAAAVELRAGYSLVLGLTDGWADFRDAVEGVWKHTSSQLNPDDRRALEVIRASARYALRRR